MEGISRMTWSWVILLFTPLTYSAALAGQNKSCLNNLTDTSYRIPSSEYKELQGWTKKQCEADYKDIIEGAVSCYDADDMNGGKVAWKMKCLAFGLLVNFHVKCDEDDVNTSCKSNSSCLNGGTILPQESNCSKNPPEIKCQCPSGFYGDMCQDILKYNTSHSCSGVKSDISDVKGDDVSSTSVIIILSVTIGIVLCILIGGIVCYKRRKLRSRSPTDQDLETGEEMLTST